MKIRSLKVSEGAWDYLQRLKLDYKFKSIEEVLDVIVAHTKAAIKGGDLNLVKQGR